MVEPALQRILLAVILLLITPAFVLWGVSGYDRMFSAGDEVAVVGGEPISRQLMRRVRRSRRPLARHGARPQEATPLATGRDGSATHSLHDPGYSVLPSSPAWVIASRFAQAEIPLPH